MKKFVSRKYLVCLAAMLASFSASIGGLVIDNEIITGFGIICGVLSGGIYAFCEAWVDTYSISNSKLVEDKKEEKKVEE